MALGLRRREGRLTKEDWAERVFSTNLERKSGSTRELRRLRGWDRVVDGFGGESVDSLVSSHDSCAVSALLSEGLEGFGRSSCGLVGPLGPAITV